MKYQIDVEDHLQAELMLTRPPSKLLAIYICSPMFAVDMLVSHFKKRTNIFHTYISAPTGCWANSHRN